MLGAGAWHDALHPSSSGGRSGEGQGSRTGQEHQARRAEIHQGEARGEEGEEGGHPDLRVAVFEDLLRSWDGEEVALRFDEPTGTWMFVCVHSTGLGPGGGGTRMKLYEEVADALRDGLRLSAAMTSKN